MSCFAELVRRVKRRQNFKTFISLDTRLHRCLRLHHLVFYAISHMIGAGLYVLTGTLLHDYSGRATVLAYCVAGCACLTSAMCYAEFASLVPRAGSAYAYTYLMLGELPAFLIGWTMLSDMLVGLAAVAKGFSKTLDWMLANVVQKWVIKHLGRLPAEAWGQVFDEQVDLVAVALLLIISLITATGAKMSLTFNTICSFLQIICLIIMSAACIVLGNPSRLFTGLANKSLSLNISAPGQAIVVSEIQPFFSHGVSGFFSATGLAVFAFSGFEALASASEEANEPRRDLPIALFMGLGVCILLYVSASFGLVSLVPDLSTVDRATPFGAAFLAVGQPGFMWLSAVAALLATGATKIASLYAVPRLFYAMANDGLLFPWLAYLYPSTKIPLGSLFFGSSIAILLALLLSLRTLASFSSIGILFCYFIIGIDLMVLRYIYLEPEIRHSITYKKTTSKRFLSTTKEHTQPLLANYTPATGNKGDNDNDNNDNIEDDNEDNDTDTDLESIFQTNTEDEQVVAQLRACVVNLRVLKWLPRLRSLKLIKLLITLYASAVFGLGLIVGGLYNTFITTVICVFFASLLVLTAAALSCYQPNEYPLAYTTKWMPLAPLITMLTNGILIVSLSWITWLRFIVWTLIGLLIYFGYGIRHSNADTLPTETMDLAKVSAKKTYSNGKTFGDDEIAVPPAEIADTKLSGNKLTELEIAPASETKQDGDHANVTKSASSTVLRPSKNK